MEKLHRNDLDPLWLKELNKEFSDLNIPGNEWLKFEQKLKGFKMQSGEFLVREGEVPRHVAFIVSGIFRAFYLTESGDEKTIVFRGKGKPLSAYSSFVKNQLAKFSIQNMEPGVLVYITIDDFEELLAGDPFWKINTGQYFMNLFIEKEQRERELLSDDAETRYRKFLELYPGLIDRINHYHIASYLGISNVSLSRIRSRLHPRNIN